MTTAVLPKPQHLLTVIAATIIDNLFIAETVTFTYVIATTVGDNTDNQDIAELPRSLMTILISPRPNHLLRPTGVAATLTINEFYQLGYIKNYFSLGIAGRIKSVRGLKVVEPLSKPCTI